MNKDLRLQSHHKRGDSARKGSTSKGPTPKAADVKKLPDGATDGLHKLRTVRFLNQPESAGQTGALVDAKAVQEKTGLMAQQYLTRQQNVQTSIMKTITQSKIAYMDILKKNEKEKELERIRKAEEKANRDPNSIDTLFVEDEEKPEKLASGFVRSERNQQMRQRDKIDNQIQELEQSKTDLQQKVNEALLKLKRYNENKCELSGKLAEQMAFVRDLQRATGDAGLEDLNTIASPELHSEMTRERMMHKQLDEQVTKAEQEKLEILDKLQLYQGDQKEIVIVQQNGQEKTFQVTQVTITAMLNEIKELKQMYQAKENEIQDVKYLLLSSEDDLTRQEELYHRLQQERLKLLDRSTEMQVRHDHAVVALENEKSRVQQVHQLHVKLLSMRILEESLQKVLRRHRQASFDRVKKCRDVNWTQTEALEKFKNVLIRFQNLMKKQRLQQWYVHAQSPITNTQLTQKIPIFFSKQDAMMYFYMKWRKVFIKKTSRKMTKDFACHHLVNRGQKAWLRRQCSFFFLWKMKITSQKEKLSAFRQILVQQCRILQHQGIRRWQEFITCQNFNARCQALGLAHNNTSIKQKIIHELYFYAQNQRVKNRSRMIRAFKNLQAFRKNQKYARTVDGYLLKLGNEVEASFLQRAFTALKVYKEKQKLDGVLSRLTEIVDVQIQNWQQYISVVEIRCAAQRRRRALTALLKKPNSRREGFCFNKWLRVTTEYRYKMKSYVRLTFIRAQRRHLQQAFNMWIVNRNEAYIFEQNKMIARYKRSIRDTDTENYDKIREIKLSKSRVRFAARQKFRHCLEHLFKRYMQRKVLKWRDGALFQINRERAAKILFDRIRMVKQRQVFKRYLLQCAELDQDEKDQRRAGVYQKRLACRYKARVFKAMRVWAVVTQERRLALKSIVKKVDRAVFQKMWRRWQGTVREHREDTLWSDEEEQIERMECLKDTLGAVTDKKFAVDNSVARLQSMLKTNVKYCMQKWFHRFHMGGLKYGFRNWYTKAENRHHVARYIVSLKIHLEQFEVKKAMNQWKLQISRETCSSVILKMDGKTHEIQEADHKIKVNRRLAQIEQKKIVSKLEMVNLSKTLVENKREKALEMINEKAKRFVGMKKERLYIKKWCEYAQRQKRCFKALNRSLFKTFAQKAIDRIRKYSKQQLQLTEKDKAAKLLFNKTEHVLMRNRFHTWRKVEKIQTVQITYEVNQETDFVTGKHQDHCSKVFNYHTTELSKSLLYNMKFKVFQFLMYYRHKKQQQKLLKKRLQEQANGFKIKLAIQKLHARARQTTITRVMIQRFRAYYNLEVARQCFLTIKKTVKNQRSFGKTMAIVEHLYRKRALEFSFDAIKYTSQINQEHVCREKEQACRQTVKTFDRMITARFRYTLSQFALVDNDRHIKVCKLRQTVMNRAGLLKRDSFWVWLQAAKKQSVVIYNEDEFGPVNLQAWRLRWRAYILKDLVVKDGRAQSDIKAILQKDSGHTKHLMKKVVIRLMLQQDADLKILPVYFEKLKMFTKMRKLFRYILQKVNRQVDRLQDNQKKAKSFNRWRRNCTKVMEELPKKTLYELQNREYENEKKLDEMQEIIEEKRDLHADFTDQRDTLLAGYFNSQKLACALVKANYQRAESKAIIRFSDYGDQELKKKVDSALTANLERIQSLKDMIGRLEQKNVAISISNDEQRPDAVNAIHHARDLETLQAEVKSLHYTEEAKSNYIRKLMEDNDWLQKRIVQEEGKRHSRVMSPISRENHSNNGASQIFSPTPTQRRNSPLRLKATIRK